MLSENIIESIINQSALRIIINKNYCFVDMHIPWLIRRGFITYRCYNRISDLSIPPLIPCQRSSLSWIGSTTCGSGLQSFGRQLTIRTRNSIIVIVILSLHWYSSLRKIDNCWIYWGFYSQRMKIAKRVQAAIYSSIGCEMVIIRYVTAVKNIAAAEPRWSARSLWLFTVIC